MATPPAADEILICVSKLRVIVCIHNFSFTYNFYYIFLIAIIITISRVTLDQIGLCEQVLEKREIQFISISNKLLNCTTIVNFISILRFMKSFVAPLKNIKLLKVNIILQLSH